MWGEGAGGRGLKMLNAKFQKEIFYAKLLQISGAFQVLYSKKQIVFPWRLESERASERAAYCSSSFSWPEPSERSPSSRSKGAREENKQTNSSYSDAGS